MTRATSPFPSIPVPVDPRYLGFWLTGLLGDPTSTAVTATGYIDFAANPSDLDTITLNGTPWTFVYGAPTGNETQIQATATQTIDQLVSDLNASADINIDDATVTVEPLTTTAMAAAQAGARRRVEALEAQVRDRKDSGLSLDGLPDLDNETERDGFLQCQVV